MTVLTSLLTMLWSATAAPRDDEGQTMAEYGLLLAGVAVVVMGVVWLLGGAIATAFQGIVDSFTAPV